MPPKGKVPPHLRRFLFRKKGRGHARTSPRSKVTHMARRKGRKHSAGRRYYRKARHSSGRPKRMSLVATLAAVGLGAAVSGTIASAAAAAMGKAQPLLATVGITTGAGLLGAAIAAKLACTYSPAFRKAYVPLIGSFGFRP